MRAKKAKEGYINNSFVIFFKFSRDIENNRAKKVTMSQRRAVRRKAGCAGRGGDGERRVDEEANNRANEVENPNRFNYGLILALLFIVTAFTVFILLMNYHPSLQGNFGPP